MPVKIFFDGGCRPNPGAMETAVVARGVVHHETGLGIGGSMDAEWLALLHALRVAGALELTDIVLLGDALAVIHQVTGRGRCRDPGQEAYRETARALATTIGQVRFRYVRRSQNLAGIALERAHGRL